MLSSTPSDPPWLAAWKNGGQANQPVLPNDRPRRPDGTFPPGMSGNPDGKKPGTTALRTRLAAQFDEGVDGIIATVKARALDGDMQAAALVLARAVPPKRPVSERTPFALDCTRSLSEQALAVAQAVADGHLAAEDALTVLTCLDRVASLRQSDTLEARLQALERATRARGRALGHGGVQYVEQPGTPT